MSVGVRQPVSRWKYWAWRIPVVVLGLVVLLAIWRFALDRFVTAEIADIHDKSYPVTLVELNRWYPRVPPGENGASVFGKAFARLSKSHNSLHSSGDRSTVLSSPTDSPAAPQLQSVEDYLDENDEALALLHQASNIPRCRFPIDLRTLSIMPYQHLGSLVRCAYLLDAEAATHADCADTPSAVVSVQALFALSHSLAKEPLVRSHLARLECQRIAVGSLQNLLSRASLADAQLEALGSTLEQAEDQRGLARAFIGQRCIGIYGFNIMHGVMSFAAPVTAHPLPLGLRILTDLNLFFSSPSYMYDLCGLLQWDELTYLRFMDRYVQTAQTTFPERVDAAQALRQSLERQTELHPLSRVWLRGMNGPRVILTDAAITARLRAARAAIAIERYRLARHQLPQTFAEVESSGLGTVPVDPFDGQPMRYRRLPSGYSVYSISTNDDHGGDGARRIAFLVQR